MKPSATFAPFQELGGDMGNMTANQRLAAHIKACEKKMSCVYARTEAEAKQIERRATAGSLVTVMPGLYARPEYWSESSFGSVICIECGRLRKSIPIGFSAPIRRLPSMASRFRMPICRISTSP